MKNFICALTICCLAASIQCKHTGLPPTEPPDPIDTTLLACEDTIKLWLPGKMKNGYIEAVNTCLDWVSSGECIQTSTSYYIKGTTYFSYISTQDTFYFPAEVINFRIPKKEGVFTVQPNSVPFNENNSIGSYARLEDDLILAIWNPDTTATGNIIEVIEINEIMKRIKGRFAVKFSLRPNTLEANKYPARLHFFDGEFDVKLPD